jgi:hypothetical protein
LAFFLLLAIALGGLVRRLFGALLLNALVARVLEGEGNDRRKQLKRDNKRQSAHHSMASQPFDEG